MQLLCLILSLFFFLPPPSEAEEPLYDGTVRHFFTHALIAYPETAFASNNEYGKHLDEDCITPSEFESFLKQAYNNGYALVDVYDTFTFVGGRAERRAFPFPKDKKPLLLSFDDLVYASKNVGKGMVDKLVLAEGKIGAVCASASPTIRYDNECVPILEAFLAEHPDFSPHGARGILCLTGMEGILGYRTQADSLSRMAEIERVKPIVEKLKESGWRFACHSYAHRHMKRCSVDTMREDLAKWRAEVGTLVGETPLYAYPYGEWVLGEDCSDGRHRLLEEYGYRVFFGVGAKPFFAKMPTKGRERVLFMDRAPLDGTSLRARRMLYLPVFDCRTAYDARRPLPFGEP